MANEPTVRSLNVVVLHGSLVDPPEHADEGAACRLKLEVVTRKRVRRGWQTERQCCEVLVYGPDVNPCMRMLRVDSRIAIRGRLAAAPFRDPDGEIRIKTGVVAEEVFFLSGFGYGQPVESAATAEPQDALQPVAE